MVYRADQNNNNRFAVYSVPITGGTSTRISEPLPSHRSVTGFDVSGNGMVAYLADGTVGNPDELFSVSATGVGTVDKLNDAPVSGGNVSNVPGDPNVNPFTLPSLANPVNGVYAVYRGDLDTDEVYELYSASFTLDADADGTPDGSDCIAYDADVWGVPGEVTDLVLSHSGGTAGTTTIEFSAPVDLGGTSVVYDTIGSSDATDFGTSATCVETDDGSDTVATDTATPASGAVTNFLVRAENACAAGTVGSGSGGLPRESLDCF